MRKLVNLNFSAKAIDEANYIIAGVFSTGDTDRHGEVVDQTGWDLKEFWENPVVLFSHDHYQPAIGKVIKIGINAEGNLEGEIQFAAKEYEFANTIFQLYKGGYMRAFSAGFINDEEIYDKVRDVTILKKNRLLEMSAVNVPANALALAYAKGINIDSMREFAIKAKQFTNEDFEKEVEKIKVWEENENTIRHRVKDPGLFEEGSFRTVEIKKDKPRVNAVMGKLKGEETMSVQSVMFPKEDGWTMESAKKWMSEHPDMNKEAGELVEKEAVELISKSNKQTIGDAIRQLTEALNASTEIDKQVGAKGRTLLNRNEGDHKKLAVNVVNQAVKSLLKLKKNI